MAPSSGHLLVPKALRIIRFTIEKASNLVRAKLPQTFRSAQGELQPVLARNPPHHPIHRVAWLRQSKGRFYTTRSAANATIRHLSSSAKSGPKYDRSSFPTSTIATTINRSTHRAPFATTLRPNLTGGALPRTAGGYSIGAGRVNGARYFSHTPAAPAQVVNNVSAAVRAFWLSGQKAQFDGLSPRSGEKRYKAVTPLQAETGRKLRSIPRATPGSSVDFTLSPTITALHAFPALSGSPTATAAAPTTTETLNAEGLIELLSIDFARALQDFAAVMNDLKRLATLGDLPLGMLDASTLRVRFPGCDAQAVERLCDEVGVLRGVVRQDPDFDAKAGAEVALRFPFAPSTAPSVTCFPPPGKNGRGVQRRRDEVDWRNMISPEHTLTSPGFSTHSDTGLEFKEVGPVDEGGFDSSPSGYESMHSSDMGDEEYYFRKASVADRDCRGSADDYEGLEGIYRFLEQCDGARRQ